MQAARLLGRHVGNRAERRPCAGQRFGDRRIGEPALLRQAEVQNLGVTCRRHQDIGRLEVAVDNPARVRRVERLGQLHSNRQGLGEREGPPRDSCGKRLPLDQLHRDEMPAIGLADVVNRADIRMVQGGGGPGFATEPLRGVGIDRPVRWQELERHWPSEPRVLPAIHHAHTPAAERGKNPIMRDRLADHCDHALPPRKRPSQSSVRQREGQR